MARVAGIQVEKDQNGEITFVRINYKKYKGELNEFLRRNGVVDTSINDQLMATSMSEDQFLFNCAKGWKKDSVLQTITLQTSLSDGNKICSKRIAATGPCLKCYFGHGLPC